VGSHDTRLKSEQEVQQNQRSTQPPVPVLGLRTASYCTENEGTPYSFLVECLTNITFHDQLIAEHLHHGINDAQSQQHSVAKFDHAGILPQLKCSL
jgi:hypothetical protein